MKKNRAEGTKTAMEVYARQPLPFWPQQAPQLPTISLNSIRLSSQKRDLIKDAGVFF